MNKPIISVKNLSKQFRLGATSYANTSLREAFAMRIRAPLRVRQNNGHDPEKTIWALRDVSFDVEPGEAVGIIGRNGAGKSTLLKILSRITEPTSGRAELYGRIGSLLEVGTGFHPELTGRENIFLNGAVLGMKRDEINRKFDEIVAFAEIERFLDTPVKRYSSGMYMRLAFAVAAHLDPEILLVDEVLAVGDAQFQKKCLGKMKNVAQEGRTVLFVSHNLPSIVTLCRRALFISEGRLVADGTAAAVVEKYLSESAGGLPVAQWDDLETAPGTKRLRLRSVRILSEAGEVKSSFEMDDPIYVEITYSLLRSGLETNVGCHVYTYQGTLAFASNDFHDTNWKDTTKEAGLYRSVCKIPGTFLNRGAYLLHIVVSASYNFEPPDIFEKEVVAFELVDNGQSELRGRYTGEWYDGVLRPKLTWNTVRLSENG